MNPTQKHKTPETFPCPGCRTILPFLEGRVVCPTCGRGTIVKVSNSTELPRDWNAEKEAMFQDCRKQGFPGASAEFLDEGPPPPPDVMDGMLRHIFNDMMIETEYEKTGWPSLAEHTDPTDLSKMALELLAQGRAIRDAGKELLPTCFVLEPAGTLQRCVLDDIYNDDDKYRAYRSVSQFARELNALAVLTVQDAYTAPDDGVRAKLHPQRVEQIYASVITPNAKIAFYISQRYHRQSGGGIRWEDIESDFLQVEQHLIPAWSQ
jgi:hypothetical protein